MKVTKLTFEGTLDEYYAIAHQFGDGDVAIHGTPQEITFPEPAVADLGQPVEKMLLRKVLERLEVPRGQRDLYRALYEAGDSGLPKSELIEMMGRTEREFTGVMGALGGRVNGTHVVEQMYGDPGILLLVHIKRNHNGEWVYQLREEFRQVLEEDSFRYLLEA